MREWIVGVGIEQSGLRKYCCFLIFIVVPSFLCLCLPGSSRFALCRTAIGTSIIQSEDSLVSNG